MLTKEQNELLTRIEPGSVMGGMLREYWVPACRAAKLERGGAPERIRLFGENFVAFRVPDGELGFFAEGCPHRCASLALARVEPGGIRCIFHGWKFDVEGRCIDMPTAPPELREQTAAKVPVRRFPVREAGGIVWVYLGKQQTPPPFPDYEFTHLPDAQVYPMRALINCNWLQGLEALLDSAHVSYLHISNIGSSDGRFPGDQLRLPRGRPARAERRRLLRPHSRSGLAVFLLHPGDPRAHWRGLLLHPHR
jgi:phthalate 4,5-dioxygenase